MAKADSSNSNKGGPSFQGPKQRPNWTTALICFILGPLLAVALIDYEPSQVTINTTGTIADPNIVGNFGANAVWSMLFMVGIAAWLIPAFLLWMLYLAVRSARRLTGAKAIAMVVCVVALSGLATMIDSPVREMIERFLGDSEPPASVAAAEASSPFAAASNRAEAGADQALQEYFPNGLGGLIGTLLYHRVLHDTIGPFGAGFLLGTIYIAGLTLILTRNIIAEFGRIMENYRQRREEKARLKAEAAEARRKQKEAAAKAKPQAAPKAAAAVAAAAPVGPVGPPAGKISVPKTAADPLAKAPARQEPPPARAEPKPAAELKVSRSEPAAAAQPAPKIDLHIVKPEEPKKAKSTVPQSGDENYKFPPLSLLKERDGAHADNSDEEHRRNAENLLRILSEFGVEVSLGEIHVGPVITRYEVVPAPGVRVEKIAGLDKNIALGMRAQSVRILAPIPGKAAVGVEVPNQHATPVGMREILESEDWAGAKAELPIALGKDVSGKPLVSDLAKMPHLLIAGATGSGKSVCINAIISSILYSKSPRDVRLMMVDPKVVELKIFNTLPHMLIPVVTEVKKVPAALKWLLGEMEQRYQMFAKVNVRNITGFNGRPKGAAAAAAAQESLEGIASPEGEIEIPERLPYIVAVIDELADLMTVAPAEVETNIARLAQLARAAGIHLIIATQRPSVNVITGVIKANLPSRIAFQVASQVDSRTILDTKGADTLIGRGDMLFSPPGTSKLVRAQGAFVSDDEVQALVDFLKTNGPPVYATEVQAQIDRASRDEDEEGDGDEGDSELGDDEELYQQALDVLKSTRRASTSMLQRRLRIGYNRAARIMEIMEEKGIVGPENGSSPREILADLDKL
jgi:S-DNA-T family DNA segregation ATPase FtsK/SpoIIIE